MVIGKAVVHSCDALVVVIELLDGSLERVTRLRVCCVVSTIHGLIPVESRHFVVRTVKAVK